MEAAKTPMRIVEHARSPMVAWGQSDLYFSQAQRFPRNQFVNSIKPKIMHQIPDAVRYYDGLPRSNSPQGSAIQVIEMGVGHEHKVDRRQILQRKARTTNAFDNFQ